MPENGKHPEEKQSELYIAYLPIGVGAGVAIGVAIGNIGVGMAIGAALGTIMSLIMYQAEKNRR